MHSSIEAAAGDMGKRRNRRGMIFTADDRGSEWEILARNNIVRVYP
jgi:hypothetical protein